MHAHKMTGQATALTMDRRTAELLEAPVLPLLLRLALPNVVVMLAQSSTGIVETYFVGRLGTEALAGVALVFPGVMLMQMISGGSMGGGISSAVSRALGAGRRDDADAFVLHALLINAGLGALCTVGVLAGGPLLYRAMGGDGGTLRAALAYSDVIYAGAVLLWIMNALASVLRGTGNILVPGVVTCAGALLLIPLSPCLILGLGPFPRLGVAGGAVALVAYYAGGSAVLAWYLWAGRSVLRPRLLGVALRLRLFADILRVGGIAALSTIQTSLTIMVTTGLVGAFGPAVLAGFGTASRLEYLLIPVAFGLGSPLVALVGTNIGAGRMRRAVHAAWLGAALGFGMTEAIGIAAALWPAAWLSLFGSDPAMIAAGSLYLRAAGPFYGFFGMGLVLYFASQGAGRLLWPVLAQFVRLTVGVGGAWVALRLGFGLHAAFLALGLALGAYGAVIAVSIAAVAWSAPVRRVRPMAAVGLGQGGRA
jgi:putative MATE family efflux protein